VVKLADAICCELAAPASAAAMATNLQTEYLMVLREELNCFEGGMQTRGIIGARTRAIFNCSTKKRLTFHVAWLSAPHQALTNRGRIGWSGSRAMFLLFVSSLEVCWLLTGAPS
jgi:hypothetical protein